MTDTTEKDARNDNQQFIVQSIGNAWVIGNSKSRPGHKYYFNSLTGESVWNLSPEEIEKAKKFTKALPKAEIDRCPEPTDPPVNPEQNNTSHILYNRKIINTQFPNMIPINFTNGAPSVSGMNSNFWNSTPNTPLRPGLYYIPPPVSYDDQNSQECFQNVHHQGINYPFSQEQYFQSSRLNEQNVVNGSENETHSRSRTHSNWHRSWSGNNPDLRQKLMRKRSKSQSCEEPFYRNDGDQQRGIKININAQEETPSKYDLSTLKHSISPHSNVNNWFIVVDTEIILNNFPFLDKITDPDQSCFLMVPDHVLTHLQSLASSGNNVKARRIYRFLSEQIESEHAFKGEDMTEITDNDTAKTFMTCVYLAKQNNVILLSDQLEYHKYKDNNYNVHLFSMNELNMVLKNGVVKGVPRQKDSPTRAIKIVVPNKRSFTPNEEAISRRFRSKTPDYEARPYTSKRKEVSIQADYFPILSKQTVDTAVQAGDPENNLDSYIPTSTETTISIIERGSESTNLGNNRNNIEIHSDSSQKPWPDTREHGSAPRNNLYDLWYEKSSKVPDSIELDKESEDSYFNSYRNNKHINTFYDAFYQNAPSDTQSVKKQDDIVRLETVPSLSKRQVATRAHVHNEGAPKHFDEYVPIPFGVQTSQNHVHDQTKNKPESVEFERASEDSYFISHPKNKTRNLKTRWQNSAPENRLDHANHTSISSKTPGPVQKEFKNGIDDLHVSKNPTAIKFSRSSTNQKQNIVGNTHNTKYRWRRQRGPAHSQMNLSQRSFVTTRESPMVDRAKPHIETKLVDTRVNTENDLRLVPQENTSRDHSLDRTSVSSQSKTTGRPSVVIEETSTSGVISNTTNDSESNSVSYPKAKRLIKVRQAEMFQVAGQSMEDVLRTRIEEWVLRFVQIMEEVLREKLRDSSSFQNKDHSVPWATDLPELARCIIKNYSDYFNVVDAANRLSFTLYRIGDEKGNVSPNVEPDQYMEMFSFGVYLIETLKDISDNCEDLNSAEESLKKLLYDIQNANLDVSINDTFVDELQESVMDISQPLRAAEQMVPQNSVKDSVRETGEDDHNNSTNSYRLRSGKKKLTQILNEPQQNMTTAVKEKPTNLAKTFFSSLRLEKINIKETSFVKKHDFHILPNSNKIAKTPPNISPSPKSAEVLKTPPANISTDVVKSPPVNIQASPKSVEVVKPLPNNVRASPKSAEIEKPLPVKIQASPKSVEIVKPLPVNVWSSPKSAKVVKSPPVNVLTSPTSANLKSPSKVLASLKHTQSSPKNQLEVQATTTNETSSKGNNENANKAKDNENTSAATAQPVVVRNFSCIARFEEKFIHGQYNSNFEDYDDEYYDDSEYAHDYYDGNGEYYVDETREYEEYDENGGRKQAVVTVSAQQFDYDENHEEGEINELEDGEIQDDIDVNDASNKVEKNVNIQNDKNKRFRRLIHKFVEEIHETLKNVKKFCIEFVEDFTKPGKSSPEMEMKMRKANDTILKICKSLTRILDREIAKPRRPDTNMILLLRRENLVDYVPDEDIRLEYTCHISECRDEALAYYKSLLLLMKAAGIERADLKI